MKASQDLPTPNEAPSLEETLPLLKSETLEKLHSSIQKDIEEKGTTPPLNTRFNGLNYYINYTLSFVGIATNQAYATRIFEVLEKTLKQTSQHEEKSSIDMDTEKALAVLTAVKDLHEIYLEMLQNGHSGSTLERLKTSIKLYHFPLDKEDFLKSYQSSLSVFEPYIQKKALAKNKNSITD